MLPKKQTELLLYLCRTRYHEKQIALSHLIPHSVLKSGGKELHPFNVAGQEVGPPGKNGPPTICVASKSMAIEDIADGVKIC